MVLIMHMKRVIVLTLSCVSVIFFTGWLLIWKIEIQPKNTRLALYEIVTASKYQRRNPHTADQLSSWQEALQDLNIKHLNHCEQIQYFNKDASLTRSLKALDRKTAPRLTGLQNVAQRYFLNTPSLEALSKIGAAEFESVMSDIQLFETELIRNGYTGTLNELAAAPKNFRTDPKEVEQIYKGFIARGEQSLASRFYPYDIPKGTANVVQDAHRFSAYAQYNQRHNSMTAYFDANEYYIGIAAFISIHEIFPGHHLSAKAGLSNSLCAGNDPSSFSWLGEGWATYVEFIADEEEFFSDPVQKLGWLDYRLTRAMRIILDVKRMEGVRDYNALKGLWDAQMPERLAGRFDAELTRLEKSRHQHLSYIFGYKAIMDTKEKLREELGAAFDEKKFHDVILRLEHREPHAFYDTVKVAMGMPSAD